MSKKMMKRIACNAVAVLGAVACLGTVTACETAHPEVEMTISFDGEDYTLEYQLYRKVAPSTVEHFLWLVENDYYDGLCVHDYDATNLKMYTGAYSVATDENDEDGIVYKPYYEVIAGYANYADFPVSVYADLNKTPLYTVYGEFSDNGFQVENGAKKQSYGSLSMYYSEKDTTAKAYAPYLGEEKQGELASRQYKYNSATSQFYMSLSATETSSAKYCTFATLADEDSVEELKDLQDAIADYIAEHFSEEEDPDAAFVSKQKVKIDEDDLYVGSKAPTVQFDIPTAPIVITKIEITKH